MPKLEHEIYLIAAVRTPIGKFGGGLAKLTAAELGTASARATLERSGIDPAAVDEVIFGNARQAGVGPNVARQIAVRSGLRHEVPAYTVNQACGSGLRAIMNAADQIRLGHVAVVLAGGTESMSNTPYLLTRARWGMRMGHGEVIDGMVRDGFMCPLADEMMGSTAETLADRYEISREEQDRFAVQSQLKASRAYAADRFANEIVPVSGVDRDEHPRFDASLDSMARLPAVFRKGGTVHAGNSSGVTDGAASMLVASGTAVEHHGLAERVELPRLQLHVAAALDGRERLAVRARSPDAVFLERLDERGFSGVVTFRKWADDALLRFPPADRILVSKSSMRPPPWVDWRREAGILATGNPRPCRRHDAAFASPAHRHGAAAQGGIVALLDGGEERVHVDVDDLAHGCADSRPCRRRAPDPTAGVPAASGARAGPRGGQ